MKFLHVSNESKASDLGHEFVAIDAVNMAALVRTFTPKIIYIRSFNVGLILSKSTYARYGSSTCRLKLSNFLSHLIKSFFTIQETSLVTFSESHWQVAFI